MVNGPSTRSPVRSIAIPMWWKCAALNSAALDACSRQERRPCGIRREARRRNALLVAARDVDRIERRAGIAARIAKEHQYTAVRRPGRALVVIALGEDALARAVDPHEPDGEA